MAKNNKLPFEFLDLNDITSYTKGVPSVLYGRRTDGTLVAIQVDDDGILASGASVSVGAVELKNGTTADKGVIRADDALTPENALVVTENGSSNSFFADNVSNAVDDTTWVTLPFGFNSTSITVINDDLSKDLWVSFDGGTTTHMKLKFGEGQTMDKRQQSSISLRSATAGVVLYRTWVY